MKRFAILLPLLASLGCMSVQPVGPMAKMLNYQPTSAVAKDQAQSAPEPVITPAPRPVPPAMLVTSVEVTETNYRQAIEKLIQEMEQDRRTMDSMPKTAEVSYLPGKTSVR